MIGAIPTGYWLCKVVKRIDVTQFGSGNIGATNVARILGFHYFIYVFLFDAGKAYLMLVLASLFCDEYSLLWVAVALLIGNAVSIFLKFKGGKGVATTIGILLYLFPFLLSVFFAVCWLLVLCFSRRPFVASLISIFLVSCLGYWWYGISQEKLFFLIFVCFWLFVRHVSNFRTLVQRSACSMRSFKIP